LRVDIVDKFLSFLEMNIHGERGCMPGNNVLFEIHKGKHMFFCCGNSCCDCWIPEVPTSGFHI